MLPSGAVVPASVADWDVQPGKVSIVVRPEHARVTRVKKDTVLTGLLENVVYFGTDTHYYLRLGDGEPFTVRMQNTREGGESFEAGQEHGLHAHAGMDKVYQVLEGRGLFLLEGRELEMEPGVMLIAPEGVPHGIRNTGDGRLVVLAILSPAP